jgi:hypothetical protein
MLRISLETQHFSADTAPRFVAETTLRADCGRCAALCCVALAFDQGALFGFDKPAGRPCPHLSRPGRCTIHAQRSQRGFAGCVAYDCYGAGQRVTQELFGGRSWQAEPHLLPSMLEAFRAMRHAHELLVLLEAAARLPLRAGERERLEELRAELEPASGWSSASLAELERSSLSHDVARYLRALAGTARRALKVLP